MPLFTDHPQYAAANAIANAAVIDAASSFRCSQFLGVFEENRQAVVDDLTRLLLACHEAKAEERKL